MRLDPVSKILIICGVVFIIAGIAWQLGWVQMLRLGKLPGDIAIEKENFRFYFPITTGLLLSFLFWFIQWLFKQF